MLLRTLLPFKRRYQERDASSGDEVPETFETCHSRVTISPVLRRCTFAVMGYFGNMSDHVVSVLFHGFLQERRDTPRPHEAAHQLHETTAGALRPRRRRTVSGDGGTSVTRIILIGGIALFLTIVAGMVLYKMRKRSSSKRKGVQTAYKRRGRSSRKLARSGSESSTADGGTDGKPAPHTPQRFRRAPSSLKKRNE
ncbi:hypothetical protein TGME49_300055 [Toxoplasma gondii ME49]|uniref:Transmembrane protein n=8 Tax=Toxoplasma gondii TaxID=5811 RepID=S7UGV4_TOXGG|nr:hypothetical protein TGME49_300055 [Toxoplasma gondii ME49]EPR56940.1 hypothetical protein TGGT1_300055 [Toxoplasma gondii GT1]KAF4638122.1 hypothetical protein TGRH88_057310 [Toxoplasma gondii]KFG57021.1 putative transmembrane protein [Toxoplasma gondii RUB]KFG99640.1 putative transmembrane protein [Toxoplasma gondii VAND]EPT25472.1 hypothetical protein TGME49_300055 [Toxoplasma gondii ME49]|eukprot:XP_018635199.1 hypothetical protein TGME49_300055 [Toxoplasma gondii ME49]